MVKFVKKVCRSYQGRHFLSRWVRKTVEKQWLKKILGFNIAVLSLFVAVIQPQAEVVRAEQTMKDLPASSSQVQIETKTETTLAWPIVIPQISQGYHFGHWGIDIVSGNREIHPIDKGWISQIVYSKWEAYGNHVIVEHPNGRNSLYAHMESVSVKPGQEVTRETVLGIMGRTGWATGIHLHLEIYQDGSAVNPLEVLPKI